MARSGGLSKRLQMAAAETVYFDGDVAELGNAA